MFVHIFSLVLFQILAPLNGLPVIGEQSAKETTHNVEVEIVPYEAVSAVSNRPKETAVEYLTYEASSSSPMVKEEPVSVAPYIDEMQERWGRKPEPKGMKDMTNNQKFSD